MCLKKHIHKHTHTHKSTSRFQKKNKSKSMFHAEPHNFFKQKALTLLFLALLLSFITKSDHFFSTSSNSLLITSKMPHQTQTIQSIALSSIAKITFDGHLSFENNEHAAKDFGNRCHYTPWAVLHPKSVSDISSLIKHIYELGLTSDITVAARGHGHSLEGQAQAQQGIVIGMESLRGLGMHFHHLGGKKPYVDVPAGELWINILHESLKRGFAPKSWTDYLHLTVGGTLSNAGISGQAFKHGPQINNVYQLQVVTGKGEIENCSEDQNRDLFHAVLGGLGQFGVITRAQIALEPAPKMVKWIRVLYEDFSTFANDQEHLISIKNSFDYVEGFLSINRTGLLKYWGSSFTPKDPVRANQFTSEGKVLFCLEVAKYYNPEEKDYIDQEIDVLLSELNYIETTLFLTEVSYLDFLDRVHVSEIKLREKGLWDVPHPWLNLLIPRNDIDEFAHGVFGKIVKDTNNGPVLMYPVNQSRWIRGTSLITPDEDVFYMVAFLYSATPSSTGNDSLEHYLKQNEKILSFCRNSNITAKRYLTRYPTQVEWKDHFGTKWEVFQRRKLNYDPLAILAPGQRIFRREKDAFV